MRVDEKKAFELGLSYKIANSTPRAIERAIKAKFAHYSTLMSLTNQQYARGARENLPVFIPAAMSSTGYCSNYLIEVQEFLVSIYAKKLRRSPPSPHGLSRSKLIVSFRQDFRSTIQTCLAKGAAVINRAAGVPLAYASRRHPH